MRKQNPHNPVRQIILQAYKKNPRVTFQELASLTGVAISCVHYHAHNLQKAGLIQIENKQGRKGQSKKTNPLRLAILQAYLANPHVTTREVAFMTGVSQKTVMYHAHKLQNDGLIQIKNRPGRPVGTFKAEEAREWQQRSPRGNESEKALQKRIDDIVEQARINGTIFSSTDVVRDYGKRARSSRLRGSKFG